MVAGFAVARRPAGPFASAAASGAAELAPERRSARDTAQGPLGYFAYDEVEVIDPCGVRSDATRYEAFVVGDRVRVTADVQVPPRRLFSSLSARALG